MTVTKPRYSKKEFAQLGDEIYEQQILPQIKESDRVKIVAIDIETGAWEIDSSEINASEHLEDKYPNAQIWFVKVGSHYIRRFGTNHIRKKHD
ncbi:MAG: hypothetical protein AB4372_09240 [Xenococcus sp. (in: cyanobacteria)]